MGINTKVYLPVTVTGHQFKDVVERLLPEAQVRGQAIPGAVLDPLDRGGVEVIFEGKHPDGVGRHDASYYFEATDPQGKQVRYLHCGSSTAFWVTLGERLVDVFGGTVDYNDCDESEEDYTARAKSRHVGTEQDNDKYYRWKEFLNTIKPITADDIRANHGKGGYDEYDEDGWEQGIFVGEKVSQ